MISIEKEGSCKEQETGRRDQASSSPFSCYNFQALTDALSALDQQ